MGDVKDIRVLQDAATKKWYATCHSTKMGTATQWGKTDVEAARRLKNFIEKQWGETWPIVQRANSIVCYAVINGYYINYCTECHVWEVLDPMTGAEVAYKTSRKDAEEFARGCKGDGSGKTWEREAIAKAEGRE